MHRSAKEPTVVYQGRIVPLKHFRVYVYNQDGELLANSYNEYQRLIDSGKWFSTKAEVLIAKTKKAKPNDTDSERVRPGQLPDNLAK